MRTGLTTGTGAPNLAAGMLPAPQGWWALATMIGGTIGTSGAPVLSIPEGQPFALLKTGTFSGVGWQYGAGGVATNALRIAIYDSDPLTYRPRNSIRELGIYTNGAGAGGKALGFSALTLAPGVYWFVWVVQGSSTLPTVLNATGGSPYVPNDGLAFNVDNARYTFPAVTSGSLPSPMTPPDTSAVNGRRFFLCSA